MRREIVLKGKALLMALFITAINIYSEPLSINISCSSNDGVVNANTWGIGAPDKYTWWAGNEDLTARIKDAKIKLVRVNPIQIGNVTGRDIYPYVEDWNWDDLDAILNTIWDADAMPLFVICGYPGAIEAKDWDAYAIMMEGIVKRYNVQKTLGANKTIKYWEMWNEPTIEGDGVLTKVEFKEFVQSVGTKMKAIDPTIKLVGPADAWADLGSNGFVAYVAGNLLGLIDVLSWHDYGPSPDSNDAARMAWTKVHYQDNIKMIRKSYPKFGAAITEFNISHQDGGAEYNLKYHNEFSAIYAASAILNAVKGGAELFTYYNLAETGTNLLGVLNNADYTPYSTYYAFYMFGNYTGNRKLTNTGGNSNVEVLATKDTLTGKLYVSVINKSTTELAYDINLNLESISGSTGTVNVRKISATDEPTVFTTMTYSSSVIGYTIPALNLINFEIIPSATSINQQYSSSLQPLQIFPNPSIGNSVSISTKLKKSSAVNIQIHDLSGKLINKINIGICNAGLLNRKLNLSNLKQGNYIVTLISGDIVQNAKLVIQ